MAGALLSTRENAMKLIMSVVALACALALAAPAVAAEKKRPPQATQVVVKKKPTIEECDRKTRGVSMTRRQRDQKVTACLNGM